MLRHCLAILMTGTRWALSFRRCKRSSATSSIAVSPMPAIVATTPLPITSSRSTRAARSAASRRRSSASSNGVPPLSPSSAISRNITAWAIVLEGASFVLRDPDADKITGQVVALRQRMQGLARNVFLGDLTLEFDAVGAVLGHGFHPWKPGKFRSIPNLQSVHRLGCTPIGVKFLQLMARCGAPASAWTERYCLASQLDSSLHFTNQIVHQLVQSEHELRARRCTTTATNIPRHVPAALEAKSMKCG